MDEAAYTSPFDGVEEGLVPFFTSGRGFIEEMRTSTTPPFRVTASPFVWRDPKSIPPRQWLYGKHYVRSYVSATVAPGGLGKSSNSLIEAVSMVSGRALLGGPAPKQLRVWVWNGEDPLDETERRVAAILLHYRLSGGEDIADRLFIDSGRTSPLILATKLRDQVIVAEPLVDELVREIREKRIDVLIIDPFVSSHAVPENDNGAIDRVAKTWARIADATGCAVELIHHVRKPANGSDAEFTVDDARGAVSLIGAVRSARVLNAMSKPEAEKAEIPPEQRRSYFRIDDGKTNMKPPLDKAKWRKLVSVPLDNRTDDDEGDWIGVVTPWEMPGALDGVSMADVSRVQDRIAQGEWAQNEQANDWAGHAIAEVLEIDADSEGGKQRIKTLLRAWVTGGALKIERRHDSRKGREKPFVVVGARA